MSERPHYLPPEKHALYIHARQIMGLQPPAQLLGFLYVGTPATAWPSGQRHPIADKVTWVKE